MFKLKMDKNGNQVLAIKKGNNRAFSIQTNGNLYQTHRCGIGKHTATEVYKYIERYGTKKQKAIMECPEVCYINGKYIMHFLQANTDAEKKQTNAHYDSEREAGRYYDYLGSLYVQAVNRARDYHGKKFHNKVMAAVLPSAI